MNRASVGMGVALLCGIFLCIGAAHGRQAQASKDSTEASAQNCERSLLLNFDVLRDGETVRRVPIWQSTSGSPPFFFEAGMTIDADGAPNAYNAENTGLDDLANAGNPAHWDGVIADRDGNPIVQGPSDPFPGFYVSCTALVDRTKSPIDPNRYVDASKIPYIVLPGDLARGAGAHLGDFAVVYNLRNDKSSFAIFGDIGTLGEGSIALADNLGIWSDARQGGARRGILYVVFPGSGNGSPRSVGDINAETAKLVQNWGGAQQVQMCATEAGNDARPNAKPETRTDPPTEAGNDTKNSQ